VDLSSLTKPPLWEPTFEAHGLLLFDLRALACYLEGLRMMVDNSSRREAISMNLKLLGEQNRFSPLIFFTDQEYFPGWQKNEMGLGSPVVLAKPTREETKSGAPSGAVFLLNQMSNSQTL
jgi:hypothetical protein